MIARALTAQDYVTLWGWRKLARSVTVRGAALY